MFTASLPSARLWLLVLAALGASVETVRAQADPNAIDAFDRGLDSVPSGDPQEDFDVPPDTPATLDSGATLNPLLLQPVRDNTLGLEFVDRPAYYYALWLTQQIDTATLAKFAQQFRDYRQQSNPSYAKKPRKDFPQFIDMFQHPDVYRGHPVTLSGYFRKLVKYDGGKNDLGIGEVYEGWNYPDDSQNNPAVVVFTEKPPGLPLGGDITEEVRFTGYFLKMYGYSAQDTTRKCPLLLAHKVQWYPMRAANERAPAPMWLYGLFTAIGIIAIWGLWQVIMRRPQQNTSRFHSPGRNFDDFPPQEFLGDVDNRPIEPHH